MRRPVLTALVALALGFSSAGCLVAVRPVSAGPLEDGLAAYGRYEFAATLKAIAPLAEAGNPRAQALLGKMYVNGHGVPLSSIRGLRWLRLAAGSGNADAQDELGLLYFRGKGVPLDLTEAARWFTLSARQGHPNAQQCLGSLYLSGDGVPLSYARAHLWFSLAERNGSKRAGASRDAVEARMTPAQIDESQRLLSRCGKGPGCETFGDQASK